MMRSQVTLYVIIGLVIILATSVFFYNRTSIEREEAPNILENQAAMVKSYVEQCMFSVALDGIFLKLGYQGMYIDSDYNAHYGDYDQAPSRAHGLITIPYWFYNDEDISPSVEQAQRRLERYMLVEVYECANFDEISFLDGTEIIMPAPDYQGTLFTDKTTWMDVAINDNDVMIKYYFPIILSRGKSKKTIEEYNARVPVPLGKDFALAKDILSRIINSDYYDLTNSCHDFYRGDNINVFYYNNKIVIHDYETLFNPVIGRTFTLQYLISDKAVYGYCGGLQ
jgi:hypothetical protein